MSDANSHQEIERKFLLRHLPPGLGKLTPVHIEQGYLIFTNTREVRIRRKNTKWFMTVKDGSGLQRMETEISLSKAQAEALWPMTSGRRVAKKRYEYKFEGHVYEVDIFKGDLDPLRICEIEFASIKDAEKFEPPDFLGEEVTESSEYTNRSLAINGQSNTIEVKERFGCLPFFEKDDSLYVVLVTNQSKSRWIFPRGQSEPGMTRQEVALMETYEEAGALGMMVSELHEKCVQDNGSLLHLYPMKVVQLLDDWPEQAIRKRQVVKLKKALQLLDDPALVACTKDLEAKLKG